MADQSTDTIAQLKAIADGKPSADPAWAEEAAAELERLRRAVAYARVRLKHPAYADRLDRIVSGALDAEYARADFTPMTRGQHGK